MSEIIVCEYMLLVMLFDFLLCSFDFGTVGNNISVSDVTVVNACCW